MRYVMFFPTWLDMILLLVSFVWLMLQQMQIQHTGPISMPRMAIQVTLVVVMALVVFYNGTDARLSTAFFVLSVAAVGGAYYYFRKVPPRLPTEPRF